jgi:hypothetical protein
MYQQASHVARKLGPLTIIYQIVKHIFPQSTAHSSL